MHGCFTNLYYFFSFKRCVNLNQRLAADIETYVCPRCVTDKKQILCKLKNSTFFKDIWPLITFANLKTLILKNISVKASFFTQ